MTDVIKMGDVELKNNSSNDPKEVFADGIGNLAFDGANFRIDLTVTRTDSASEGETYRVPVTRLVIPGPAMNIFYQRITDMFEEMKKKAASNRPSSNQTN